MVDYPECSKHRGPRRRRPGHLPAGQFGIRPAFLITDP